MELKRLYERGHQTWKDIERDVNFELIHLRFRYLRYLGIMRRVVNKFLLCKQEEFGLNTRLEHGDCLVWDHGTEEIFFVKNGSLQSRSLISYITISGFSLERCEKICIPEWFKSQYGIDFSMNGELFRFLYEFIGEIHGFTADEVVDPYRSVFPNCTVAIFISNW